MPTLSALLSVAFTTSVVNTNNCECKSFPAAPSVFCKDCCTTKADCLKAYPTPIDPTCTFSSSDNCCACVPPPPPTQCKCFKQGESYQCLEVEKGGMACGACRETCGSSGHGLSDPPIIAAGGMVSLNGAAQGGGGDCCFGGWNATSSAGFVIKASVPGDIISDLQRAKAIGDPLFELNFKNASLWSGSSTTWTYARLFYTPEYSQGTTFLIFDGVKMGATIAVNGKTLGVVTDQFVRYNFSIGSLLRRGQDSEHRINSLTVTFDKSVFDTNGRFMACTGGWDWGPFSNTFTKGGDHTFSYGISKDVYLINVPPKTVAITAMVPSVTYRGTEHLVAPLVDGTHAGFVASVMLHIWAAASIPEGVALSISGDWDAAATVTAPFVIPEGSSNVTLRLNASAEQIKLWWPLGLGGANATKALYSIDVALSFPDGAAQAIKVSRRVGFRVVSLVTTNDTDAATVARDVGADGSGNHGMLFRVNGAALWTRGASVIPMDNFEGRYAAEAHAQMVASAAEGKMNMLRIWGGGIFLPTAFYAKADELGVLIYHDMMYTTTSKTHEPNGSVEEARELADAIRRLASHPSIIVWNSCNECSASGLYVSFVMTIVAQEDTSRPIWPGCPSMGWSSGVDRLSGRPNGKSLQSMADLALLEKQKQKKLLSLAAAASHNCTFEKDFGYQNSAGGKTVKAATKEECCALCWGEKKCVVGVFVDGTCYEKFSASGRASKPGVVSCHATGKPPPPQPIESHGPYVHGNGWMAVNIAPGPVGGKAPLQLMPSRIPIDVDSSTVLGLGERSRFASEFGASVFSSFESMSATLGEKHWSLHGGMPEADCSAPDPTNSFWRDCKAAVETVDTAVDAYNPMAERNYPCDPFILVYFGGTQADLDAVGEAAFKRQLYLCQLAQALEMSGDIASRRGQNQFGTLVWQLNEIWPTGGWGSLEYGTTSEMAPGVPWTKGQVLGGRWRPLHYFYESHLFADVFATCGASAKEEGSEVVWVHSCYCKNDGITSQSVTVVITGIDLQEKKSENESGVNAAPKVQRVPLTLSAGPGAVAYFELTTSLFALDDTHVIQIEVVESAAAAEGAGAGAGAGAVLSSHIALHMPPVNLTLAPATITMAVGAVSSADGSVPITLTSDATAMYVYLTTAASGRFDANAILLRPGASGARVVRFLPFGDAPVDLALLKATLREEHV